MEQRILLDSTDAMTTHPRVMRGDGFPVIGVPATGVTARVGTPAIAMPAALAATGVSERFSRTTTTNAAASEGATSLSLSASLAMDAGDQWVIALSGGRKIVVTGAGVSAGSSTLLLREPLPLDVASGSTVTCTTILYTFTAAQTAMRGRGLAIFQATIDSRAYQWHEPFRIVRRYFNHTLTPTLLTQHWPFLRPMRDRQDVDFEELIRTAFDARIRPLLAARNIDEDDVINAAALEPLHALACAMQVILPNQTVDSTVRESMERRWAADIETTFARNDWWEATQQETPSIQQVSSRPATGIRITR